MGVEQSKRRAWAWRFAGAIVMRTARRIKGKCIGFMAIDSILELDFDQDVPHSITLAAVNCSSCHEEEGQAYVQSVHSRAKSKGMDIQCYACHGYHYVVSLAAKSVLERENKSCLKIIKILQKIYLLN